jgi:hypothetical protein
LTIGLVWLLHRSFVGWRAGKPRRTALRRLLELDKEYQLDGNIRHFGIKLSELLRRAMLAYAPRAEVAGLTGERWLQWLDQGMQQKLFSEGPGQTLGWLPYCDPQPGEQDVDVEGLVDAVRQRLRTPIGGSFS